MWGDLAPVRLTVRPLGGQGQPYGDDVVAAARHLAETTGLTNREIAARVGVSHMTIGRWARSGGWLRPNARRRTLRPWRLLEEAEGRLLALERAEAAGLDAIETVLSLALEARDASAALIGTRALIVIRCRPAPTCVMLRRPA